MTNARLARTHASVILLCLLIISSSVAGILPAIPKVHAVSSPSNINVIAVNPPSIAGPSYTPGSQIVFTINVTQPSVNASAFNGFTVAIEYDNRVLNATSIDTSGTVLGSTFQTVTECINGKPLAGVPACTISSGGGVELSLLTLGTATSPPTNGVLFKVTLNVNGTGFSPIHFVRAVLTSGSQLTLGTQLPVKSYDGYFTNIDCPRGSGVPCKSPVPFFDYSPRLAVAGRSIQFNATKSWSPNKTSSGQNASIISYSWDFSGGFGAVLTVKPLASNTYDHAGLYIVTLTINDADGAVASLSFPFQVIRVWLDLGIGPGEFSLHGVPVGVLEGTLVNVTAQFHNYSSQTENSTVEIMLENSLLARKTFLNVSAGGGGSLSQIWNTAGARPRVYRLEAMTLPITNSTTGQVIENDTTNDQQFLFIQIIEPLPASFGAILGLGLGATFGLGIVLLAALGTGFRFLRRTIGRKP